MFYYVVSIMRTFLQQWHIDFNQNCNIHACKLGFPSIAKLSIVIKKYT